MIPAPLPEELKIETNTKRRNLQDERKEARDQLSLVQSFFARVDAKASALFAINTAMLAVLASNAPLLSAMTVLSYVLTGLSVLMIAASLWFLYRVAFPSLDGGQQSLIYFREIACRTETGFIDAFSAQDEEGRIKDLLGQVWRNSCILTAKFTSLKRAFILLGLAIIPWGITVALFSSQHPGIRTFVAK